MSTTQINFFDRDDRGLIKNFPYVFTDDGRVDYRALLKPEHLYVPKEKVVAIEKKYGKAINELDKTKFADNELAILLSGLKYLLALRGYVSLNQKVDNVTFDSGYNLVSSCTVTCSIEFIPNFESYGKPVTYSDVAGASLGNLDPFVQRYAESMAANRALQRTIRGFLGISICSKDEIGPQGELAKREEPAKSTSNIGSDPKDLLTSHMKSMGLDFKKLKENVIKRYSANIKHSDPQEWEDINSINVNDIFTIIGILVKSKEKLEKTA